MENALPSIKDKLLNEWLKGKLTVTLGIDETNWLIQQVEKNQEILNAYQRMIEMYQFEVRQREKEQEKLLYLSKAEYELRNLMNTYIKRQEKLKNEIEEAKRDGDVDGELTGEVLYRQMRHVIAELFQVMKRIGILDDDEIAFGCVKQ